MTNDYQATSAPQVEALIRRGDDARFTDEYNCKLRRLFPWPERVETHRPITEFGAIWVRLDPGVSVDEHHHDEEETFIVISGSAELTINGAVTSITRGDTVYVPRNEPHSIRNVSPDIQFEMLDIYWDMGGKGGHIA